MIKKILSALICLGIFFLFCGSVQAGNEGKTALVMKALSNPFFIKMRDGAVAYAQKSGTQLEVFGIERETEVERQIGIMENLVARGYGAIVIAPADSKKLIPVCKKALEKGIVVINIDNPFHKETLKEHRISIPFVGSDNRAGAAMVGEYIKKQLNGTGKAIIIEGIRGVENADLRKQGFMESLTSKSRIKVIASETANWHTDEAFSLMTRLLEKHGKVDAVLCANDSMAMGVIQALDLNGLGGKVWVGAYDNIDEARAAMRNRLMHATIEQHPEMMGAFGVELADMGLIRNKIPDYKSTPLDLITFEGFDKKIGLSISRLSNPFFTALHSGAKEAAKLFGLQLITEDAQDDDVKQLLSLKKFIDDKVDIIILNPTNAESVVPAMEIAQTKGIKILTVDRKSSRDDLIVSHVASDNLAGGQMAAEFIAQQLEGRGRVMEFEGIPGTSAAHERGTGFNKVMAAYPDIKISIREIADFKQVRAMEITTRLLSNNLEVDAVFAHNDEMILGVIQAFETSETPLPKVLVGFDAVSKALEAIKKKQLTATIAQKPAEMGWKAVQAAAKVLRGDTLPLRIPVDLKLITGK
ncbi:substrate-binding domain-containing protein [Desulfobacterales bacterium HSG17]|nr:substrate-binding domain-containing protein [Desulfobacterales bacterium HSG17]